MKPLLIILIVTLLSCSFDTKTGIWENSNIANVINDDRFKDFETLYTEQKTFNEIVEPKSDLKVNLDPPKLNLRWLEEDFQKSNSFENFSYNGSKKIIFKSKKLSRNNINEIFFFDGENLIATDDKGYIIFYSVSNQNIFFKFNFYKKKYKDLAKNLNILIENNIIYVSDNLGYLYAIDYFSKKLIWAKNFKVPFRSNLKQIADKIILTDTNNILYFINKLNGEIIKNIPTEENLLKSSFVNSLSIDDEYLFYLNTYGTLYSIDHNEGDIKWFININKSISINSTNLFYSNPIFVNENNIIIAADPYLHIFNSTNGLSKNKLSITSLNKPIVSNNKIFIITKDNLLVCYDLSSSEIIYSIDISSKIAELLDTKKKSIQIKTFFIANSKIFIFLSNSYLVEFSSNGKIQKADKLPSKLNSSPIFINNSILYIDKNNRLIILD